MRKRAGRPEIAPSQRREEILRFVVTKSEAVKIRSKAKALKRTISEYLRSVAIPKD
jgi:hypothetical protein